MAAYLNGAQVEYLVVVFKGFKGAIGWTFADIIRIPPASDKIPSDLSFYQRKLFMFDLKKFFWDDPYFNRSCADGIFHYCVPKVEMLSVLEAYHSSSVGGHYSGIRTAHKFLHYGYYWLSIHQDAHEFAKFCDLCQQDRRISKRQELSFNPILVYELFDIWGIDFMVPFVSSHRMKYILVEVDYVSKWVEAITLPYNEGKSVTAFLKKNIFSIFGTPRVIISDGGSNFCNKLFKGKLEKYGVLHNVVTPYHPQTSGEVEVSN
nr:uncharacterized protein K02A2.6-like [Solanum lycopersicum]